MAQSPEASGFGVERLDGRPAVSTKNLGVSRVGCFWAPGIIRRPSPASCFLSTFFLGRVPIPVKSPPTQREACRAFFSNGNPLVASGPRRPRRRNKFAAVQSPGLPAGPSRPLAGPLSERVLGLENLERAFATELTVGSW